jgi:hypothetical protein
MDRIDTHSEFKRSVVEPDFREFMENKADLRKAWHCAGLALSPPRVGLRST